MRPVPPLLSAFAGAGCLLVLGQGPAGAADADATPRLLDAGDTVTVLVSCDQLDGRAPRVLDATSPAFAEETVRLKRVSKEEQDPDGGPAYRGRAKLAAATEFEVPNETRRTSEWDVEGVCPGGEQWTAAFRIDETRASQSPEAGGDRASDGRGAGDGREGDTSDQAPSAAGSSATGTPAADPGRPQAAQGNTEGGGTVHTAALAGGSALLLAAMVGAVRWKRRASLDASSRD